MTDNINHPRHYFADNGMEAIDVIESFFHDNYFLGNVFKYIARAGKKGNLLEDLGKAEVYLQREIDRVKEYELREPQIAEWEKELLASSTYYQTPPPPWGNPYAVKNFPWVISFDNAEPPRTWDYVNDEIPEGVRVVDMDGDVWYRPEGYADFVCENHNKSVRSIHRQGDYFTEIVGEEYPKVPRPVRQWDSIVDVPVDLRVEDPDSDVWEHSSERGWTFNNIQPQSDLEEYDGPFTEVIE